MVSVNSDDDDDDDELISGDDKRMNGGMKNKIGWISYSVCFNILNSMYSVIYPKILEEIGGNSFSSVYSLANFLTTLFSSFLLPCLGSIINELHLIKDQMILSLFIVIFFSWLLFPIGVLSSLPFKLVSNGSLYVLSLFFLRYGVMNNNALLPLFNKEEIGNLSLFSNFFGFSTVLVCLLFINFYPKALFFPDKFFGLSTPYWWLLIAVILCFVISSLTFFAPSDRDSNNSKPKKRFWDIVKFSFLSLWSTIRDFRKNREYFKCWLFLFSYLFYSTAGTIFTIYLSQTYITLYHLSLDNVVQLNIFFQVFLVLGVCFGIFVERLNRTKKPETDLLFLLIQNFMFIGLLVLNFVFISIKMEYVFVMVIALFVGFLYSWNASVSRSLMSKLVPLEKKSVFMSFYSSFTYLGISIVSLLNTFQSFLFNLPQLLYLLLIIWTLPSLIFFFLLFIEFRKSKLP